MAAKPPQIHEMSSDSTEPPLYSEIPGQDVPSAQPEQGARGLATAPPPPVDADRIDRAINNQEPIIEKPLPVAPAKGMVMPDSAPTMVTPLEQLQPNPTYIDCPWCHRRALTRVTEEASPMQYVTALLCCLVCVCAVCVPALCHWFEDKHIHCSACGAKVVTISHEGQRQIFRPSTAVQVPSSYPGQA